MQTKQRNPTPKALYLFGTTLELSDHFIPKKNGMISKNLTAISISHRYMHFIKIAQIF